MGRMGARLERPVRGRPGYPDVSPLVHRLAASPAFQQLFREGMGLVEEAAAYLDGPGRVELRTLSRPAGLAYATESMRLTTRLMQIASWLLLQRAVNEGELTPNQALSERHRVKLARQALGCAPETLGQLPVHVSRPEPALAAPAGAGDPSRPEPRGCPRAACAAAPLRSRVATRAPSSGLRIALISLGVPMRRAAGRPALATNPF